MILKISEATRIALYAIITLAARPGQRVVISDIADMYGISANHLAKVMRPLTKAGLVKPVRGQGGGFTFVGNAKRFTFLDVIRLFEGQVEEVSFEAAGGNALADELVHAIEQVFSEVNELACATLDSVTVNTVVKQSERPEHRLSVRGSKKRRAGAV